jgi:hypothetical protein
MVTRDERWLITCAGLCKRRADDCTLPVITPATITLQQDNLVITTIATVSDDMTPAIALIVEARPAGRASHRAGLGRTACI